LARKLKPAAVQQRGCPDLARKELAEVRDELRAACIALSEGAEDELILNIMRSRKPKS